MLVNSGATEHFLDDELFPGSKDWMKGYASLGIPKTIVATGNRKLRNWNPQRHHRRPERQDASSAVSQLTLRDLGCHIFSSSVAMNRGVDTILEEGNLNLRKGGIVVPLQQREEDLGLKSFEVEIGTNSGASSPGIGAAPLLGITGASSRGIAILPGLAEASSPRAVGASSSGVAGVSSPRATAASSPGVAGAAPHRLGSTLHHRPRSLDHQHSGILGSSGHHQLLRSLEHHRLGST